MHKLATCQECPGYAEAHAKRGNSAILLFSASSEISFYGSRVTPTGTQFSWLLRRIHSQVSFARKSSSTCWYRGMPCAKPAQRCISNLRNRTAGFDTSKTYGNIENDRRHVSSLCRIEHIWRYCKGGSPLLFLLCNLKPRESILQSTAQPSGTADN